MSTTPAPLTGASTIQTWLDDPAGGDVLRGLLAQGGQSAEALAPIAGLPLQNLVAMSGGAFPQEALDALVAQVNPDYVPAATAETPKGQWAEKITAGRFTGQTVIVTGAGSGIGRATASRVAREGGRVIAVDVSQERLDEFVAAHEGADVVALTADITDDEGVARIIEAAGDRIDGLANIAGIMDDMTPVGDVTDAVWDRVFRVNVTGTMKLMRAVIPAMLAQGGGSIVNTSSEASLRGSAAGAAYTASKHAVVGLTKSSAYMYGPSGIRVNAVAPGAVITNIEAKFNSPLGAERVQAGMAVMVPPVTADRLAASITFLLSDDGVNVNGQNLASDGGWSAA
ncbi:SDR family NAD(P)-dependent oxidoreductase [Microbacterium kyungheense]|uniref:NAD(P)-dependent dehydrogenase (Short-subunit alcohol dehydrogenase family) n=1 Tax=Microbacterium kyungheense TaxID=1263636 RepID=A0A543FJB5_9MICO|nr:SDR family NAD(P)-dependent oxidoreductase [Microbacterium kyungheense]TQM33905.1 NAD(P)-dependent dehydrogenase (short-subunit alcohol dehydrogenase family) [Microbacterium kyungheense]